LPKLIPRQLPSPPVHFTNRHRELSILDAIRAGPGRLPGLVVLKGSGGVGKSALALRWLDLASDRFGDGELYATLSQANGSPIAVEDVLGEFLRSLGVAPDRVPARLSERVALFRSITAGRSMAVLLEDAVSAAQVKVLLPASTSSVVVVTSRQPLAGLLTEGAVTVPVDPLDARSAFDLLRQHIGTQRVESEADQVAALIGFCAGLPIALCIVAAQLALRPRRSMAKLVDELRSQPRRLDALSMEDMSVRATFDLSYRALPEEAAAAYVAIGVHPGTMVSTELVATMLRRGHRHARRALDVLVDASMLEEVDDELFRCHDLVRVHAAGEADATLDHEARASLERRALEWHLRIALVAGATVMPSRPRPHVEVLPGETGDPPAAVNEYTGALAWLERHRQDLVALVRLAADTERHEHTYALGYAMQPLFIVHKHLRDAAEVDQLALDAALSMGDHRAEVKMRKRLARVLIQLDEFSPAQQHIDALLARSDQQGDRHGRASGLKTLARLHARLGRHDLAVDAFAEAVRILRNLGEPRRLGLALTELGTALTELGSPERAATELDEARRMLSGLDPPDPYNAARATVSLARAHLALTELDTARRLLGEAQEALERLGADRELGRAHETLAELHTAAGDEELALEHRRRADEIVRSLAGPAPDASK
jgi:tetratricopeptide (TPR) repeat protein